MTLVHATCIAVNGAGVLIRGPSGSGKSDLALRLIDEGADLVADDYCTVTPSNSVLQAEAPASIAGKIEVRGYGVVSMPYKERCSLALIVDLMARDEIERLPDSSTCTIDGVVIKRICIDADTASAAAKVRVALKTEVENTPHSRTAP